MSLLHVHKCSQQNEYDAAVAAPSQVALPPPTTGITIGSYDNCAPVAEGVTSEVYRCDGKALKVIVHTAAPHNPRREAKLLATSRPSVIPLLETFWDDGRFVLVFPYMPLTLADLLSRGAPAKDQICSIFADVARALAAIHGEGIIHRDVKPSAVLLQSDSGPAVLSDFGTAWLPGCDEAAGDKILDIGTGAYRAPEVLFADKSYTSAIDMWALGVMLAEATSPGTQPPFESRAAHEDGNQLGLILSIFKTLGTPTAQTWPEATGFKVSPFELWTVFSQRTWEEILPNTDVFYRDLIAQLVSFESGSRATASQVLQILQ